MKKIRIIMVALSIMMVLCMEVSCAPEEAEKPFVSGLGTKINAYQEYGGWIYYIDYANTAYLYKVKSNGKKRTLIIDDPVYSFTIYENRIFYTNWKFYVYSANIDGSNDKKLYSLNEDLLADSTIRATKMQIENDWIYILDDADGAFYKIKTDGTEKAYLTANLKVKDFYVDEDSIYYLKRMYGERGVQLWKMALDGAQDQQLIQEVAVDADYDENWIYYSANDELYKLSLDENKKYMISQHNGANIKVLNDWIYYIQVGEDLGLYKIRKDGSEDTLITDDLVTRYSIFGQWLICYGKNGISAVNFGELSETKQLTYDIISEWPNTTIHD